MRNGQVVARELVRCAEALEASGRLADALSAAWEARSRGADVDALVGRLEALVGQDWLAFARWANGLGGGRCPP